MISFIVGKQNNEPLTLLISTSCKKDLYILKKINLGKFNNVHLSKQKFGFKIPCFHICRATLNLLFFTFYEIFFFLQLVFPLFLQPLL